ncbi:MAG: helix-turn-helix transcriptional regulator [Alphaproteobacteria bacterium]|nr:helix-turn-helix transcriptional regulator [Alphaproteobacteria bacterium]
MGLNVEDVIAGLDPAERRKVEALAEEFISEEMTLRELRKARHLTQVSVARELGVSQDAVSRMEQRSDLLLSTLRRTVEAMGGSLSLIATFPDRPPVELAGIAESESRDRPSLRIAHSLHAIADVFPHDRPHDCLSSPGPTRGYTAVEFRAAGARAACPR